MDPALDMMDSIRAAAAMVSSDVGEGGKKMDRRLDRMPDIRLCV